MHTTVFFLQIEDRLCPLLFPFLGNGTILLHAPFLMYVELLEIQKNWSVLCFFLTIFTQTDIYVIVKVLGRKFFVKIKDILLR